MPFTCGEIYKREKVIEFEIVGTVRNINEYAVLFIKHGYADQDVLV